MLDSFSNMGRRAMMYVAFQRAKQPSSIKQVLTMVYESKESIDNDLVDSIVVPATDPQVGGLLSASQQLDVAQDWLQ